MTWTQRVFLIFGVAVALVPLGLLALGAFALLAIAWSRLTTSECPNCGMKL